MISKEDIPKFEELFNPVLDVLRMLGGSASIHELETKVAELLNLPNEVANLPHSDEDIRSEFEYRLAWARTYLKTIGLITNSERGVWSITPEGYKTKNADPSKITREAKKISLNKNKEKKSLVTDDIRLNGNIQEEESAEWKNVAMRCLLAMHPTKFEMLCQRLLREAGFVKVEVTGKSGDGGIDGKGVIQFGLLSFQVVFQCKRYQGNVSSGVIRDFRGAMAGRAEKGLIITTGNFTNDARQEATRSGATPIDLIDGDSLLDLLKKYNLGIKAGNIESVNVDQAWFNNF